VRRGEVWWAALCPPTGSGPRDRRSVVIIRSDPFNRSRIGTVIVAALTSNLRLHAAPGNVLLARGAVGLDRDPVIKLSQIITIDRTFLTDRLGRISLAKQRELDEGLRLNLELCAAFADRRSTWCVNEGRGLEHCGGGPRSLLDERS
jgi:mRNA interferase MazF